MDTKEIFNSFKDKNILVIGDMMLDTYHYCESNKQAQEAPDIDVLAVKDTKYFPGGAANVVMNLKAMGANPIPIGLVGNDTNGSILKSVLYQNKIDTDGLINSIYRKTTDKTRYILNDKLINRIDNENNYCATTLENECLLNCLRILRKTPIDAIIIQDYGKGVVNNEINEYINKLKIKKPNIFISYSPSLKPYSTLQNKNITVLNLKEACSISGAKYDDIRFKLYTDISEELSIQILKKLCENVSFKNSDILLTLGDFGIFYYNLKEDYFLYDNSNYINDTEIKNTTGAGDTVLALFSAAMMNIDSIQSYNVQKVDDIIRLCNIAGNAVISNINTKSVDCELIENFMETKGIAI